jgi:hypothetical protein
MHAFHSDGIVSYGHALHLRERFTAVEWSPVVHSIVKEQSVRETLHSEGHIVVGNIGAERIGMLRELYLQLHSFKLGGDHGGMFYSLYSKDVEYRQTVYDRIDEVMATVYASHFQDFKSVIHSFIAKLPGDHSGFTLHQDSSGLDETKYSPLSLWIPLQDTDLSNGTLCVVPKTHGFFHPYRGISFKSPFSDYERVLRKYLVPIELRAGDILAFDNRLVHYSHLNRSNEPRVVVMSGLFPAPAQIEVCYRDMESADSPIEVYRQSEDFLITNLAFYENCTARPYRGEKVREVSSPCGKKSVYDFLSWAHRHQVEPTNIAQLLDVEAPMHIVSEP